SVVVFADGSRLVTIVLPDGSGQGIWTQRYDALGNEDGPLQLVNSTTTGNQYRVETLQVSEDRALIYWVNGSHSNGYGWTYAQYVDNTGAPIGEEFALQPPDARVGSFSIGPEVAILDDGAGSIVTVWSEYTSDSSVRGVWVGIQSADGSAETATRFFAAPGYSTNHSAEVVALAGGNFVVSWTGSKGVWGSDTGIYAQIFSPSGEPIGTEFHVNTTVAGAQTYSQMLVTEQGFMVTWLDNDTGTLRLQHYLSDGTVSGDEQIFELEAEDHVAPTEGSREIIRLDSGALAVSWQTTDGVTHVQVF
ncbi:MULTISPECIES: hypothetical protein, partial [unclassified Phaeobacter]